jgi:hypothetical protein
LKLGNHGAFQLRVHHSIILNRHSAPLIGLTAIRRASSPVKQLRCRAGDPVSGESERIQHRTKTRLNWRYPSVKATATPVPQSQFGLGFEIHCPAVSGTEKVLMSKIPIFAGFDAAEILMLAAVSSC